MQIASNRISGGIINRPDQCINTWTNFALMTDAVTFSPNVTAAGGNLIFMATVLAMSHGDEPDTPLFAPTIGPAFFPMGIPTILVNGNPAISMLCPSISNAGNATQGYVLIPSAVNVLMMFEAGGASSSAETPEGSPVVPPLRGEEVDELVSLLGDPGGPGRGTLLPSGLGHVSLGVLSSATPSMIHGAVRSLVAQGARAILLDLRACPGGDLLAALEIAGDFLDSGTLLATLVDADGDETERRARPGSTWSMPVIVWVGPRTASSAEILAGTLQVHGRAVAVGQRTFGKGTVQRIESSPADGALRRSSVAHCLLPNGEPLTGGIKPDIELEPAGPQGGTGVSVTLLPFT